MSHNSNSKLVISEKFQYLPHKIYEINLRKVVENLLGISYGDYKIQYSEGSSRGDNYIGVIYRAEIIYEGSVKLSVIIKVPPSNPARREEFFLHRSFVHESDFYGNLYHIYKKFQENKGVKVNIDGFHQVPKCYKAIIDAPLEGLYFEDLRASGFEIYSHTKELSKEHVCLVMRVLAKMHATFFCIKDQNPDLIASYRKRNDYFILRCERKGSLMNSWYESSKKSAVEVINKSANDELKQKVNTLLSLDILTLFKTCLDLEATEPYATMCHGDCWNSNIMYKNDETGTPIDVRLLDFQIMRYASPVCDLMYYIFSCTTKTLRMKYYQEFINIYYDTLSRFIERLGSETHKVFPRFILNDHLKRFGKFGLVMGVLVLPVFTSDVDDVPDMDDFVSSFNDSSNEEKKNDNCYITEKTREIYEERLMGACEDMLELGYL